MPKNDLLYWSVKHSDLAEREHSDLYTQNNVEQNNSVLQPKRSAGDINAMQHSVQFQNWLIVRNAVMVC